MISKLKFHQKEKFRELLKDGDTINFLLIEICGYTRVILFRKFKAISSEKFKKFESLAESTKIKNVCTCK